MWVAVGMAAAAVIGGGASYLTNQSNANAAEAAASNNLAMGRILTNENYDVNSVNRSRINPYYAGGQESWNQMMQGMSPGGQFTQQYPGSMPWQTLAKPVSQPAPSTGLPPELNFQADPGYAWRKQQGIDAIAASQAAGGGLGTGQMGTELVKYGQGFASNEYQNYLNQYNKSWDQWNTFNNQEWNKWNTVDNQNYNRWTAEDATGYGRWQNDDANAYNRWMNNSNTQFARLSGMAGVGIGAANTLNALDSDRMAFTANALGNGYAGVQNANVQGTAMRNQGASDMTNSLLSAASSGMGYGQAQGWFGGAGGAGGGTSTQPTLNYGNYNLGTPKLY